MSPHPDTLTTALEHADLRELVGDLYPEAGVNPTLARQRIRAAWRGGDNPAVASLSPKALHDFKTGETWNAWSFLTEVAGFSRADAAGYVLERAGLAERPQERREGARRERVASSREERRAAYLEAKLAAAHAQQSEGAGADSSTPMEEAHA